MNRPFTPIKLRSDSGPRKIAGVAAAQAAAHAQDTQETLPFAPLRQNNQVECFTTGEKYYTALRTVLKGAKKSIFIAGWQVNWDLELASVTHPGERLIDILADRI